MDPHAPRTVVAVVNDLMFGSRIKGAATHLGVEVAFARSTADLHALAADAAIVLIDLEARWLDAALEIQRLKSESATQEVRVVAFCSHVQTERLMAAREAGADRVMARSAFMTELPKLLVG